MMLGTYFVADAARDFDLQKFILGQTNIRIKFIEDEIFEVADVGDVMELRFVWPIEVAD
jgi:hypothetical protein